MTADRLTTYWHGGQAGLGEGDYILPPSESGAKETLLDTARRTGTKTPATANEVYVTTEFGAALLFAAAHPSDGWVYQVEPEGELRPDPDCDRPGLSFACDRARIVWAVQPTREERDAALEALVR